MPLGLACRWALTAAAASVAFAAVAGAAALEAPFPLTVELGAPTAYLNLYIHVPLAWTAYLLFAVSAGAGLAYLARRRVELDRLSLAAAAAGELYGFAALATGMVWASESWGAPWSWDPRQTGVLLLLLAYLGYFAVRTSIPDPERRRLASAAYAVAAFAMVPLSFLAAYLFESLHPTVRQTGGFLSQPGVRPFFYASTAAATLAGLAAARAIAGAAAGACSLAPLRRAAPLVAAVAAASALAVALPYLTGEPVRVVSAGLEGGRLAWIETEAGTVAFPEPVESPVSPPVTPNGTPSIVGHLVEVTGGGLRLVTHWSVAANLLLAGAAVSLLLWASPRIARMGA